MNGMIRRLGCWLGSAVLACNAVALAQEKPAAYPLRPIRLILVASPGAGGDAIARAAAQMMTDAWGQPVIVDSRPGASGAIAVELVAKSTPDGYTLLSLGDTLLLLGASRRVPFDIFKAFDPIVPTSTQPYILVANPSMPFRSIKELVAYSANRTVTYSGASGAGNTVHLGMERLAQLSGAKLLFVPYKGTAPAMIAVMGGEINLAAGSSIAASAAIKTGKVRALAAMGPTRIPAMPDLPTVAEQGYPDFKIVNRYGLHAPAGTPHRIMSAINHVVSDGMHSPQMTQRLQAEGAEPAERMTPEQLKAAMMRDFAQMEQQVKRLNLKIQ